jgi:hypothetical protein
MPPTLNGELKLTTCDGADFTWDFVFVRYSLNDDGCAGYLSPIYDCGFDGGSQWQVLFQFECDGAGNSVAVFGVADPRGLGFTLCPSGILPGTVVDRQDLCPKINAHFTGDCANAWSANCWCASNPTVPASFDLACNCATFTLSVTEP